MMTSGEAWAYIFDRAVSAPGRVWAAFTRPEVKTLVTVQEANRTKEFEDYTSGYVARVFEQFPATTNALVKNAGQVGGIKSTIDDPKKAIDEWIDKLPSIWTVVAVAGVVLLLALFTYSYATALARRAA